MDVYHTNRGVLIALLLALFCLSVVDVVLRTTVFKDDAVFMPNYGEPLVTIVLSLLLIVFALKGKERAFYILCGGWLSYFVLCQLFDMPAIVSYMIAMFDVMGGLAMPVMSVLFHLLSMVFIIVIGCILVEYMNDGTIHNKAFNVSCAITILMFLGCIVTWIYTMIDQNSMSSILGVLNNLSRLAMVLLFVYFAYDSAKIQLNNTRL